MRGESVEEPEFVITYVNGVDNGTNYATRVIQDHRYALIYQPWSDGQLRLHVDSTSGLTLAAMRRAGEGDPRIAERVKNYVFGVPVSFFDRRADPGERKNLIHDPRHRARIARMQDALLREMARTGDPQLDNIHTMIAGGTPTVVQPAHKGRQYHVPVREHGPPRPTT